MRGTSPQKSKKDTKNYKKPKKRDRHTQKKVDVPSMYTSIDVTGIPQDKSYKKTLASTDDGMLGPLLSNGVTSFRECHNGRWEV